MGAHKTSDTQRVLDVLRRIVQALRLFDRQSERRARLSGAQAFVLQNLRQGGAVSMNELAARTHTDQSSVSVIVGKLVQRRLIKRAPDPADGRRVLVAITDQGQKVLRAAPPSAQRRLIDGLHHLSVRERRKLAVVLENWLSHTGLSNQTPTLFFEPKIRIHRGARGGTRRNSKRILTTDGHG